ncbi:CRTAC1 family protein [Simiduia agarivorans]|uniref:ASPIC/UnbV domain-containing protein n=1 Tax=Simiduia agarivorans (strain DSM 21679 / JCM 13881 / BCRC 17597 / SA1) TaxID=1117647 RepID=K4KN54_SIMAS|nr:CRTAC1 family protein [Simiduia agarivorans]AFV00467.1 hypothetical protein M5M_16680 [Simiduia agarivorans SA1 = DSM 21679]
MNKFLSTVASVVLLVACGGGGGDSAPAPSAVAPAPTPTPTATPTPTSTPTPSWQFTDVTDASGLIHRWGVRGIVRAEEATTAEYSAGGFAVGDYDGDGWIDVFIDAGDREPSKLFRNLGGNKFQNVAATAGVQIHQHRGSGPMFADVNGDGWLDLFVGGLEGDANYLFLNNGDGTFDDYSDQSGLNVQASNTISAAFGDYNKDGFLDLVLAHWGNPRTTDTETLFQGSGTGYFENVSIASGIAEALIPENQPGIEGDSDYGFTPTFADLNNDGWSDLTMVADFSASRYFLSDGLGRFSDATDNQLTDQFGMGSALGDFDNDGDLDWFVTSIYQINDFAVTNIGNRLYKNNAGRFSDVTFVARVEQGGWGWGACFADVNNDGYLDIFHTNGYRETGGTDPEKNDYRIDENKMFISEKNGRFKESAEELKLNDAGQGRGVACFDADQDGDIDILVSKNDLEGNGLQLFRNDGHEQSTHYLRIRLKGAGANTEAAGARVYVSTDSQTQMREVMIGSNFVSQNPAELHFGLADASEVDEVRVRWLDGTETVLSDIAANQLIVISQ